MEISPKIQLRVFLWQKIQNHGGTLIAPVQIPYVMTAGRNEKSGAKMAV